MQLACNAICFDLSSLDLVVAGLDPAIHAISPKATMG